MTDIRETFDVVVVGTGAAGLSAALSARAGGAKVLVIEKAPVAGGTTAMSGGCIWAPRHHYTAEIGVTDSREAVLDYIRAGRASWLAQPRRAALGDLC